MKKHLRKLIASALVAVLAFYCVVSYQRVYAANDAGDFTVTGDTGWSYSNNVITISSSGTYTITGDDAVHSNYQIVILADINVELTINNVQISNSSAAAMSIDGTSTITLILVGDNSIISTASGSAGIQFNDATTGSLTITAADDDASLTATGGFGAAGIGGGSGSSGNDITILGGTVFANGGDGGAGIGGGSKADGYSITISGGTVTAIGGGYTGAGGSEASSAYYSGGAGIGGGGGGDGYDITISGGNVTATGSEGGAGIGGGYYKVLIGDYAQYGTGSDITISGGTVTATGGSGGYDIGNAAGNDTASDIIISGGSVKATNAYISGIPTDGNGKNVYLYTIDDMSGVDTVTVDGVAYTRDSDHPDHDGAFYLYLTGEDHIITIKGIKYNAVWNGSSFSLSVIKSSGSSSAGKGGNSGTVTDSDSSSSDSSDTSVTIPDTATDGIASK